MIALTAVVLAAYVIVATVSGRATVRRYGGREIGGAERMGIYRQTIVQSWCAALLLLVLALTAGTGLDRLGLGAPNTRLYPIGAVPAVISIACGVVAAIVFAWQGVRLVRDSQYRRLAWMQLTEADARSNDVVARLLIPRTRRQRRRYYLVAVTAGICEEIIFRGIAFAVLAELLPDLPSWMLPVLAAALFAVPHAYQGAGGIAKTGAIGLVLGFLFAATGFLPACMLVHAIVDLASAHLAPEEASDLSSAQ